MDGPGTGCISSVIANRCRPRILPILPLRLPGKSRSPKGRARRCRPSPIWDCNRTALSWRPDGRALVFAADSAYRDEWTYGRSDLWTVTTSGDVRRLTSDGPYSLGQPAYSPDGERIAFVRRYATDWVISERIGHGGPTRLDGDGRRGR